MKRLLLVISLLLLFPLTVLADAKPKVLTLETTVEGSTINYSGTTEANSHAVMCKLYNSSGKEVNMLSVNVNNNSFTGTFTATSLGEYKVACANYEGGEIKEANANVLELTATTYTVTFETNGGSNIAPAEVEDGATVAEPEPPTKEGYAFGGWYADATFTTRFDFRTPITNTTTIYAKWTNPPVTVHTIFLGEGGTYEVNFEVENGENQGPLAAPINSSAMYDVPDGEEMTLSAIPDETHHFKGWYSVHEVDSDGEGHMEWVLDELLSSNTDYTFTPSGFPYIAPVFEENIIIHRVIFETNGGSNIEEVEIEHDGVVQEPEAPSKDGYDFGGWYEDATLTTEFDFETRVSDDLTLYAKWIEEVKETYTVTDNAGNIITFKEEEGHEFALVVVDIMQLTDEELAEFDITREEYNEVETALKEAVKKQGTVLSFYDIVVIDEDDRDKENGPFTFKIKMTDDMKKFNSFKLLYIDVDNNFKIEEIVDMKVENGYLVGTLPHLSNYVLVGSKTTNNPTTFDSINLWVITLLVSLMGLIAGAHFVKKNSN